MPHHFNILMIIADQLAWKAVSAYAHRNADTPNIDQLATQGARLTHAYTSCPLCQPARASVWTGRFPHETKVLANGRNFPVPQVPESMPTLGDRFTHAGYDAVHFGKTHDAGALRGFRVADLGESPVAGSAAWPAYHGTKIDRHTTEQVVDYLQQPSGKPFFLVADLVNPHDICNWVGDNQGPHEDIPIEGPLPPLPDNFEDVDFHKRPLPVQYVCCAHNRLCQASGWNERNYRHYLAAYHHYTRLMDEEVGRILSALRSRPDADNTIICFMADHGDGMAAHRLVTKHTCFYEELVRVPMIFTGPGIIGHNRTIDSPIASHLDLFPTLCELAGVEAPPGLWGQSLAPWLRGQPAPSKRHYVAAEWHTEWGYTIEPGRMIRTACYKYTRYLEGDAEELFDLLNDPGETRTLIDDPAHAHALNEHRALLNTHIEQTDDPFFSLQYQVDARWREHTPGYTSHTGPAAPMLG